LCNLIFKDVNTEAFMVEVVGEELESTDLLDGIIEA